RTRLVVLAGCDTGTGRGYRGEGVLSLARPFLASGVPRVIATLWSVADSSTLALVRTLHQRLRAGDSAAAALRTAQIAMLRSGDPKLSSPRQWAGFQLIGAT